MYNNLYRLYGVNYVSTNCIMSVRNRDYKTSIIYDIFKYDN